MSVTQEQYDEIVTLNKEYKTYSETISNMEQGLLNLQNKRGEITRYIMDKCDHTYPDGRSALESYFYHQCIICGAII